MKDYFSRKIRNHSLKSVIISYITVFSVISVILLSVISYFFMSNIIVKYYLPSYMRSVYSSFEHSITNTLTQINLSALNITTWQELYTILLDNNMEPDKKRNIIENDMKEFLNNHNMIFAVDIITNTGEYYRCSQGSMHFPIITDQFKNSITSSAMLVGNQPIQHNGEFYIAIGNKFYNYYNSYDVGYLVLYIKESTLYSIYKDSLLEDSVFFILSDNHIISHSDKSALGSMVYIPNELYNDEKLSISRYSNNIIGKYHIQKPILASDVSIVTILSSTSLFGIVSKMERYTIIIFSITLALVLIIAFIFTQGFLNQYTSFKKKIVEFTYNPKKKVRFKSSNELHELEESFNVMVSTINHLMEQNSIANEKQREAEIKALQAHINPHFIYNALDTITCMAKLANQPNIEKTSYALASFFRIGLSGGERLISISDELEHVKSYIHVQQSRYPDKFDVKFDIPEALLSCKIVKITLQPLVENCIKHGFKGIPYRGKITIMAITDIAGKDIIITVSDNGTGFNANPLLSICDTPTSGYGIYNVQRRLKLEYGENYGLIYELNETGGTTVIIKIKYETD